jgi:hypothetical protein
LTSLADRQHQFGEALLDQARAVPAGLSGPPRAAIDERFAVYRTNVTIGLVEGLRNAFPVVDRLVGDAFFTAMAATHVLQSPPSSPVLLRYGRDFPAFVESFAPAAGLPYLAGVARLEWLWLESYHAAEAAPLTIADLHAVPTERLPLLRLALHPSARPVGFDHPARTIWQAHQTLDDPATLDADIRPEAALIVRPHAMVSVLSLSSGGLAFLLALRAARTIADAAVEALAAEPAVDLPNLINTLFDAGTFCGFADAPDIEPTDNGENT